MTIITKVGASYADHMNDDVPEDNSFSRRCYQAVLFVYVVFYDARRECCSTYVALVEPLCSVHF